MIEFSSTGNRRVNSWLATTTMQQQHRRRAIPLLPQLRLNGVMRCVWLIARRVVWSNEWIDCRTPSMRWNKSHSSSNTCRCVTLRSLCCSHKSRLTLQPHACHLPLLLRAELRQRVARRPPVPHHELSWCNRRTRSHLVPSRRSRCRLMRKFKPQSTIRPRQSPSSLRNSRNS